VVCGVGARVAGGKLGGGGVLKSMYGWMNLGLWGRGKVKRREDLEGGRERVVLVTVLRESSWVVWSIVVFVVRDGWGPGGGGQVKKKTG